MKKLNVCLINDSFPPAIDGVANAVTNYANIISSVLGNATVVTPFYPDADDSGFEFPVVRYPSLDTTRQFGYRAGMPLSAETIAQLENSRFDIIHSHCPITSTMLARTLRDRVDIPLVMTYHTKFDIDIANALRSKLLQGEALRLLVENISACDEVWTVSHGAGDNLRKIGYTGDYIVMPNGVDFPKGRVDEDTVKQVAEPCDLPEGIPIFLFVGRMMWYKGIRIILDALKTLKENGVSFRMVFVGAGGDKDEICAYSSQLGLDDCVFFSPAIHNRLLIRAWYCRADLFLFPSTFDTNGLVVREAAACGLASVLVGGSCAAEDVDDGVNGFLIEENAASMAAKLTELCSNPEKIKAVGEGAQRDLYMSWEDAVHRAYERYGIVIENYKRDGRKVRDTDFLVHGTALMLDSINRNREYQRNLRHEIQELQQDITDDINEVKLQITETRSSIDAEIQARLEEKRKELAARRAKIDAMWQELAQQIERFM